MADVVRQSQRADAAGAYFGDATFAQRQPDRDGDSAGLIANRQSSKVAPVPNGQVDIFCGANMIGHSSAW